MENHPQIAGLLCGQERGTSLSRDYTEMQLASIEAVRKAVADWTAGKVKG